MKTAFKAIFISSSLMALSQAIPAYVRSSFLEEYISVEFIGLVFVISSIFSLAIINLLPRFISRFSNYRVAIVLLMVNILALGGIIFSHQVYWLVSFFVIAEIVSLLVWINMDLRAFIILYASSSLSRLLP